jgi:hypothetical protein
MHQKEPVQVSVSNASTTEVVQLLSAAAQTLTDTDAKLPARKNAIVSSSLGVCGKTHVP